MKTKSGTCHFISVNAAFRYYAPYGSDKAEVLRKIQAGEIMICPPEPKAGQEVTIENGQYFVIE